VIGMTSPEQFFRRATGYAPCGCQTGLAADALPSVVQAATGGGTTGIVPFGLRRMSATLPESLIRTGGNPVLAGDERAGQLAVRLSAGRRVRRPSAAMTDADEGRMTTTGDWAAWCGPGGWRNAWGQRRLTPGDSGSRDGGHGRSKHAVSPRLASHQPQWSRCQVCRIAHRSRSVLPSELVRAVQRKDHSHHVLRPIQAASDGPDGRVASVPSAIPTGWSVGSYDHSTSSEEWV
jgi:hypothetical protein